MQQIRTPEGNFLDHWATEDTLQKLVATLTGEKTGSTKSTPDVAVFKEILNTLKLMLLSDKSNRTIDREIQRILLDTQDEIKEQNIAQLKELMEKGNKSNDKDNKEIIEGGKEAIKISDNLKTSINRGFSSLSTSFDKFTSGDFNLQDIVSRVTDMVTSVSEMFGKFFGKLISGMAAVAGGAIGLVVGAYEQFGKTISQLASIGAGINMKLEQFKNDAAVLGVSTEQLAKIMVDNSSAMIGLGDTTQEGINNFTKLGVQVQESIKDFHNFGMTNSEVLEVMAQEIELRRRSGQNAATIQTELAEGMSELLFQSTALAAITGQDVRELYRARQERMKDAVVAAHTSKLQGDALEKYLAMSAITTEAFGPMGKVLADAVQYGQATATGIETQEKLLKMSATIGGEAGDKLIDLARRIDEQSRDENITSKEFQENIDGMATELQEILSGADLTQLSLIAQRGANDTADIANAVLETIVAIRGLGPDVTASIEKGFKDTDLLGLASSVERMAKSIEASFMLSVVAMVEKLPGLGSTLEGKNLADLPDLITDFFVNTQETTDAEGNTVTTKKIKTIMDLFKDEEDDGGSSADAAPATTPTEDTLTRIEREHGGELSKLHENLPTPTSELKKFPSVFNPDTSTESLPTSFIPANNPPGNLDPMNYPPYQPQNPSREFDDFWIRELIREIRKIPTAIQNQ